MPSIEKIICTHMPFNPSFNDNMLIKIYRVLTNFVYKIPETLPWLRNLFSIGNN